jgi:hypothetical protein
MMGQAYLALLIAWFGLVDALDGTCHVIVLSKT